MPSTPFARAMVAIALTTISLTAPSACAADDKAPQKFGLPIGARTKAFTVHDVTGPAKGSRLCYI